MLIKIISANRLTECIDKARRRNKSAIDCDRYMILASLKNSLLLVFSAIIMTKLALNVKYYYYLNLVRILFECDSNNNRFFIKMAPAPRYSHAEEQHLVMKAAIRCINESSLLDFKMNAIAKHAGISMGSVYKHVKSKEDVLVALTSYLLDHKQKVMTDVLSMPFSIPQRLLSTALVDPLKIHQEPFGAHLEMMISNEAILNRASPKWLEDLQRKDRIMEGIFSDCLYNDPALLTEGERKLELIEELMVGLWSMHVGFIQVAFLRSALNHNAPSVDTVFPLKIDHPLIMNTMHVINAYPWQKSLKREDIAELAMHLESLGYR